MNGSTAAAEEIRTQTFDDLPLSPFLKETIREVGYTTPTPIQAEAIPMVLEGRDLIGLAQTGTGKTAAFVLPILEKLSGSKEKGARVLILAPTRELAEQINDTIKTLSPRTGLKSMTIYGGVSHGKQLSELRGRPQFIVACPGRLLDHISGRTIDLSKVDTLVLDEADRMFDMGFLPEIKKIIKALPEERQTLLFSATMPDEVQALTREVQKNPGIVRVKTEDPKDSVTHAIYPIQEKAKQLVLSHWLKENKHAFVLVFTRMKFTAKRLAEKLEREGVLATAMHGNLSQAKRQQSLNGFKKGRYNVLIATDIAARGIDVPGITHVVNYDMPENIEDYIHRIGRAGRASATGEAVSFVTKGDGHLLRSIERWLKAPITRLAVPDLGDGVVVEDEVSTESSERRGRRGDRGMRSRRERTPRPGRRERQERRGSDAASEPQEFFAGSDAPSAEGSAPRERRGRSDRPARGGRPGGQRGGDRRERRFGPRSDERPTARRERSGDEQPRSEERSFRGDRAPRERFDRPRTGPGRGRREGGFSHRSYEEGRERQPRLAYGPEADNTGGGRRSFNRGGEGRSFRSGDRKEGRFGNRGPRSNGNREDRPYRPDRGQPRDRFQDLEARDMSQTEALKVLERKEHRPARANGNRGPRGNGGPRGGRGFGGGRDRWGGGRDRF